MATCVLCGHPAEHHWDIGERRCTVSRESPQGEGTKGYPGCECPGLLLPLGVALDAFEAAP